jgi:hypothetical protein
MSQQFQTDHNRATYTPVFLPIKHGNGQIENFKIHRPHTKYGLIQAYQWRNSSPVACAVLVGLSLLTEVTFWGFRNLTDAIKAASGQPLRGNRQQPDPSNVMDFEQSTNNPAPPQAQQPPAEPTPEPTATVLDMDDEQRALAESL